MNEADIAVHVQIISRRLLGKNMNNQLFDLNDIENEPSDEQLLLHEWTS